ncbi:MAG: patatin-like phospholipase family protein, partial [Acidobacteriota bacterium]
MNGTNKIDTDVVFEYLKLSPFFLSFKDTDKKRWMAVFNYWERNCAGADDRKLAHILAAVHHRKKEAVATPLPFSEKLLSEYFSVSANDWSDVEEIKGQLDGASDPSQFSNILYTVFSRIRPLPLSRVLSEEIKRTRGVVPPDQNLESIFDTFHEAQLTALCFSGGGIRSATFGLGIVQALAQNNLLSKFDYLSTVSGGGYLGSWLSAWILREKILSTAPFSHKAVNEQEEVPGADIIEGNSPGVDLPDKESRPARKLGIESVQKKINGCPIDGTGPNPEPTQLQHLREYSNYMSPRRGLLSADTWTLIAIYLRNLFLNLTIFLPLIAAVLMLPRFLFLIVANDTPPDVVAYVTLLAALFLGGLSMAFVISKLPSKQVKKPVEVNAEGKSTDGDAIKDDNDAEDNTDLGVFKYGVLPLLLSAFCAASLWAWNVQSHGKLYELFDLLNLGLRENPNLGLIYLVIGAIIAFLFGGMHLAIMGKYRDGLGAFSAFVSTMVGAVLLWLVCVKIPGTHVSVWERPYAWQIYLCLAIPLFFIIVLASATVFVGLSSGKATDEDREWLARFGAWVLIVAAVWALLNALVLLAPSGLEAIFRIDWTNLSFSNGIWPAVVSVIGVISGAVSLFGGFSEKSQVRNEPTKSKTAIFLAHAPKIAAVIFLGFIFVTIAYLTSALNYAVGHFFSDPNMETFPRHATILTTTRLAYFFGILVVLVGIGVVMAFFVNVNKFSLHGAYRDRLVRAYLGASNTRRRRNSFTGFDDRDNFQLHRLKDQKPFHVINATVNLVGGKTLAWQNRKAASFTMSPLHCGSWTLGYRNTNEYCRNASLGPCAELDACNQLGAKCALKADGKTPDCQIPGKAIRLGTAMAISGAAANPNMGYYSSSVVTFLMSLFNIRLGWWLGNTNAMGARLDYSDRTFYSKSSPTVAMLPLLNETLGWTDENKRYINVTDGGHFENLALYEMVLRRCKFIVLSDGAADDGFKFGEIANAIQKCKVDLGVDIQFVGSMNIRPRSIDKENEKLTKSRFTIARIKYPETYLEEKKDSRTGKTIKVEKNRIGWLLYTRPTYYENEPRDIMNYAESNLKFPHQSTGDQMYDEKQFEAYRGLGFLTMSEIEKIFVATAQGDPDDEVDDSLEDLFADEDELRETVFGFFGLGGWDSYQSRKKKVT